MTDVEPMLRRLGQAARCQTGPHVDVRSRVLESIATPTTDRFSLVFTAAVVGLAALLSIACLPSFQTLLDPWASYLVDVGRP